MIAEEIGFPEDTDFTAMGEAMRAHHATKTAAKDAAPEASENPVG